MGESLSMTKRMHEQQAVTSKSEMRQETIQRDHFQEPQIKHQKEQEKTGVTTGPKMAMEEAPAWKLGSTRVHTETPPPSPVAAPLVLGKLGKKDRTGTHSDVQRLSFKKNMLQNVAMDEKAAHSKEFKNVLELIKNYANVDVIAGSEKKERDKEIKTLIQIMKALDKALNKVEEKEKKVLLMYKNYFELDTGGYLSVPQTGVLDCTKKVLGGKRGKKSDTGEQIPLKPIKMESKKDDPLFPHEPSINDIVQGGLGDCYLLAALSAVVSRNPQWIKDCMKDLGNGEVVVRLYDKGKDTKQFVPKYIKIRKQTPKGEPFAAGSLWVQLIEQAYTASEMHKPDSSEGGYEDIVGGIPEEFMERIMGIPVEKQKIQNSTFRLGSMMDPIIMIPYTVGRQTDSDASKLIFGVSSARFGSEDEEKNKKMCEKMYEVMEKYSNYFYAKEFSTMDEAVKFFIETSYDELPDFDGMGFTEEEQQRMKKNIMNQMKLYFENHKEGLHYKAFSGSYTEEAIDMYDMIQRGQEEGKMMTASSRTKFIGENTDKGLNEEEMEDALAANHAYTLLGVRQLGEHRFIMIRNPWDKSAREYTEDVITHEISRHRIDADTHGIYLLELNDFMTHFSDIGMI